MYVYFDRYYINTVHTIYIATTKIVFSIFSRLQIPIIPRFIEIFNIEKKSSWQVLHSSVIKASSY